jgi:beta-lactamase regulating signal transducer with metallopeptidase domain
MPHLDALNPIVEALGMALLHFVWQGTLIAFVLAVTLRIMRRRPSSERYVVRCAAMMLMAAAPAVTIALVVDTTPADPLVTSEVSVAAWGEALPAATSGPALSWLLPWLVLAWSIGAAVLSARLLLGWWQVCRIRRCEGTRLPESMQQLFEDLARQLRTRAVARMVPTSIVAVPSTIGWLRPVVLLPIGMFSGLSEVQIRAIIAHELAHIRRADYLVNVLQSMVEALLFYHPAVWWVSHGIRTERECCCDDVAVALARDPFVYARALTALETWRQTEARLGLSTLGGPLMYRIQRLLSLRLPPDQLVRPQPTAALLMAGALGVASVGVAAVPAVCPPEKASDDEVTSYELHRRAKSKDQEGVIVVEVVTDIDGETIISEVELELAEIDEEGNVFIAGDDGSEVVLYAVECDETEATIELHVSPDDGDAHGTIDISGKIAPNAECVYHVILHDEHGNESRGILHAVPKGQPGRVIGVTTEVKPAIVLGGDGGSGKLAIAGSPGHGVAVLGGSDGPRAVHVGPPGDGPKVLHFDPDHDGPHGVHVVPHTDAPNVLRFGPGHDGPHGVHVVPRADAPNVLRFGPDGDGPKVVQFGDGPHVVQFGHDGGQHSVVLKRADGLEGELVLATPHEAEGHQHVICCEHCPCRQEAAPARPRTRTGGVVSPRAPRGRRAARAAPAPRVARTPRPPRALRGRRADTAPEPPAAPRAGVPDVPDPPDVIIETRPRNRGDARPRGRRVAPPSDRVRVEAVPRARVAPPSDRVRVEAVPRARVAPPSDRVRVEAVPRARAEAAESRARSRAEAAEARARSRGARPRGAVAPRPDRPGEDRDRLQTLIERLEERIEELRQRLEDAIDEKDR